ncbi:Virulence sensor protein BvgS [compost metagenome]
MQLISKQNQLIVYEHKGTTAEVFLDQNLLKNCIINLVSNAIKYSGEDTLIQFNSKLRDKELIIEIIDNGIGIPEADLQHLFEPFFRAHNTGDIPGTGLGLNIVQRYVELMNGKVACRSSQNVGTTIELYFKF